MEQKFYICKHCGNIVAFVKESGAPVTCCGEKMQELVPNTVDASSEKHVPVVSHSGSVVNVSVGSVSHPMGEDHHIAWIILETKQGVQRKNLRPDAAPQAEFLLAEGDEPVAAYAYCNLHGLWKA